MMWILACGRSIADAGRGEEGSAPTTGNKIEIISHQTKIFFPILIIFPEASNDSGLLKLGMPFLKEKLIG